MACSWSVARLAIPRWACRRRICYRGEADGDEPEGAGAAIESSNARARGASGSDGAAARKRSKVALARSGCPARSASARVPYVVLPPQLLKVEGMPMFLY